MKPVAVGAVCSWLLLSVSGLSQTLVLPAANELEDQGRFREAAALLAQELQKPTADPSRRKDLEFALDRLERIKKDFPYTQETLFSELKKSLRHVTKEEYIQWVGEGRFETREIDGRRLFMAASVANLFFRYPELSSRRGAKGERAPVQQHYWENCVSIKKAALTEHHPYVLPKRFRVSMTVVVDTQAVPAGEMVRAWLPVPRESASQHEFRFIFTPPGFKHLDAPKSPIRSVYLEAPTRPGEPTTFQLDYEYVASGVWFDIKSNRVIPSDPDKDGLKEFTREGPHIAFTPELRALSQQIAGNEANPCLKARRFYEWISENIKYSFALEYSTIRNISETCFRNRFGDCGEESLLFMTLCRLSGIPARWQSGWNTFPGAKSIHDWCEIYLAPYGWVPVDPYMGIYAMRYANSLKPNQRRELRDFYFGGLDQFRLVANSDHNQSLVPPKNSMRSDDVDFQRGELEWGNHNIYFDQFSFRLTAEEGRGDPLPPLSGPE